ncbi:hypothetical protein SDC9_56222 [bioreactor metagenome]|uniref:Uncharacterized protein n=1 Tax=bioreactor metagenome TaxID=1076179 RepID=A0A644X1D2_9ZZZZ
MLVNGAHPNITATRQRDFRAPKTSEQCSDEVIGGTKFADHLVGCRKIFDKTCVKLNRGGVENSYAHTHGGENADHCGDVADLRDVFNPADTLAEQCAGENGKRRIFRPADGYRTGKRFSAAHHIFFQFKFSIKFRQTGYFQWAEKALSYRHQKVYHVVTPNKRAFGYELT